MLVALYAAEAYVTSRIQSDQRLSIRDLYRSTRVASPDPLLLMLKYLAFALLRNRLLGSSQAPLSIVPHKGSFTTDLRTFTQFYGPCCIFGLTTYNNTLIII